MALESIDLMQHSPLEIASKQAANSLQGLEGAVQVLLSNSQETVRFAVGQTLSSQSVLADRVHIILEGQARLVGEREGTPFTIERLGP